MQISTILFDLDDTLYPPSNGLWLAVRKRMDHFMYERLNLTKEVIPTLRHEYFIKYGTTLRGLQIHYQVEPHEFLNYVHDLPIEKYVTPDPLLRKFLLSLKQNKWIFTNSDQRHVFRVLSSLGVTDCFQGIIDITAMNFVCKPDKQSYQIALRIAGESTPISCLYLDDSTRNLEQAKLLGFKTVLVGNPDHQPNHKTTIRHPSDLYNIMPELWSIDL